MIYCCFYTSLGESPFSTVIIREKVLNANSPCFEGKWSSAITGKQPKYNTVHLNSSEMSQYYCYYS